MEPQDLRPLTPVEIPEISRGLYLAHPAGGFKIYRPLTSDKWAVDVFTSADKLKLKPWSGGASTRKSFMACKTSKNFWQALVEPWRYGNQGADPEICAVDETGNFLPSHLWLAPVRNGQVYRDGLLAEFSTEPAGCLSFFVDSVRDGLKGAHTQLTTVYPTAQLTLKSVFEFTPEQLQEFPEESVQLGCAPSFN